MKQSVHFLVFLCIVCVAFLFVGCKKTDTNNLETSNNSQAANMEIKDYQHLVSDNIAIGDSYQKVIAILGTPNYEKELVLKEKPGVIGKTLTYVISQKDPRILNEKTDQFISFYFDKDNQLSEILPWALMLPYQFICWI